MMRTAVALALVCCFAAASAHADAPAGEAADVVFRNGIVYTVDSENSRAQSVAIKGGKFIHVGSDEEAQASIGEGTQVVDLGGKMVLPGLIDSHIHAVRGGLGHLFFCKFPVTSTVDQILDAVKGCVAKAKKGDWIEGTTWDSALAPKLTAATLDKASPDNPVYLHDDTNHLSWVNSAALKAASITKDTKDPAGGRLARDKSGAPTGVIYDSGQALIIKVMPPRSQEQLEQAAEWIFAKLNSYGVTGARLAQLDKGRLAAYRGMEKAGKLTVRLQGSWDFNTRYATLPIEDMAKVFDSRDKRGPVTDLINPDGVKIYADGVWIGYGSPMIDMYETGETYGRQSIDQPTMKTWVTRFDKEGLSVMIHAVGDQAVRNSLNSIAAARRANGPDGPRHHVGHNTFVHAEDRGRSRDLNLVREVSPANTWYPSAYTPGFIELLGKERVGQMVPVAELIKQGGTVVYGSDWDNVPEPDPWMALQTLVTRANPEKPKLGTQSPQEAVDLRTAIRILTINGAHAIHLEKTTGSIEVGKDADMIVIDQDLFSVPQEQIIKTKVQRTILKGKTVYQAK